MSKVIPWSYSSLTGFETCPFKFFSTRIAKTTPTKPFKESNEGILRHKAIENYLRSGAPLPPEVPQKLVDKTMLGFDPNKILVEKDYGITFNHEPCGFWDKNCYYRAKLDVIYIDESPIAHLIDWKSGKIREDSKQLEAGAVLLFDRFPHVQEVKTSYVWFKYDHVTPGSIKREEKEIIWSPFVKRVELLQSALDTGNWPKKPSGLCREYCEVTTCQHNGAYRNGPSA